VLINPGTIRLEGKADMWQRPRNVASWPFSTARHQSRCRLSGVTATWSAPGQTDAHDPTRTLELWAATALRLTVQSRHWPATPFKL